MQLENDRSSDRAGDADARRLARFGYAQQLRRRLGSFSSFAIGFSVISVLTGVTSTFGDALAAGGPAALGLGWPLVSAGSMLLALAMAELASAFPTAGALYHWAAMLGGPAWGWATAMLNLCGQIAIVAAIDLACARAVAESLHLPHRASSLLFLAVIVSHGAVNAWSVRGVGWLNDASAAVHAAGVVVLAGLLLAFGRVHPVHYLAETPRSSADPALGFIRSLVLGVWTFTGFDAAAHVSEETRDPERRAPVGIVSAVSISAVAGYALVAALTLSVRDPAALAGSPDAALDVLRVALGERAGRSAMMLAVLAMWFAGLSSMTSASRMLFAFARDGGVPGASTLRRVSVSTGTPVHATAACMTAALLLVALTAPLGATVFLAVAVLATLSLVASYALPIGLGVAARLGGRWTRRGRWSCGAAAVPIAVGGVCWALFVGLVCGLADPPAVAMFAVLLLALAALWFTRVRRRFEGPRVRLSSFEHARDVSP